MHWWSNLPDHQRAPAVNHVTFSLESEWDFYFLDKWSWNISSHFLTLFWHWRGAFRWWWIILTCLTHGEALKKGALVIWRVYALTMNCNIPGLHFLPLLSLPSDPNASFFLLFKKNCIIWKWGKHFFGTNESHISHSESRQGSCITCTNHVVWGTTRPAAALWPSLQFDIFHFKEKLAYSYLLLLLPLQNRQSALAGRVHCLYEWLWLQTKHCAVSCRNKINLLGGSRGKNKLLASY